MTKPGTRVIAIHDAKDSVVKSFGSGVYAGDFKVAPEAGGMNFGQDNPRIDLDSGKTVWGCECWWGEEKAVRNRFPLDHWTWKDVDIDEVRQEGRAEGERGTGEQK